jgi:Uma2 family endonuclease
MDVVFSPSTVVEPDVVFLGPERAAQLTDDRFVDVVPDLVVEVSSPSTRRLDLIKKRSLYEREGVPEYWFVDLEAQLVDVHRLDATGYYGAPATHGPGDTLTCLAAPELRLPVAGARCSSRSTRCCGSSARTSPRTSRPSLPTPRSARPTTPTRTTSCSARSSSR